MDAGFSRRTLARLASALLVGVAVAAELARPLPKPSDMDISAIGAVSLLGFGLAVAIWPLPWNRWPRLALLPIAIAALVLEGLGNYAGNVGPYAYSLPYALVFGWVGLALPRWSSLALAPLFAASYLLPMLALGLPGSALASFAIAAPVCLALGEATAWVAAELRETRAESELRSERMRLLVEATSALAACDDRAALARLGTEAFGDLLGGGCVALVVQRADGHLDVAAQRGWPEHMGRGALAEAAEGVLDIYFDPLGSGAGDASLDDLARDVGLAWADAVPLRGSSPLPAGIALIGGTDGPRPRDGFLEFVSQTLTTQVGLGLERLHHTESLEEETLHDPLTGLGNRRKADLALAQLKDGDALAMLDLDHFKQVNDRLGHAAGDRLLEVFSEFLRSSTRTPDETFRMGGEEFVVVLRGSGPAALRVVERICGKWRDAGHVTTFSAGVAVHADGLTAHDTLGRADTALYAAKRTGRDRVVAWTPDLDPEEAVA